MPSIQQPFIFWPKNTVTRAVRFITGNSQGSPNPTYITDFVGTLTILNAAGQPVTGANAVSMNPITDTSSPLYGEPGWYGALIDGTIFDPVPSGVFDPSINMTAIYTTVISGDSLIYGGVGDWPIPTFIRGRNSP